MQGVINQRPNLVPNREADANNKRYGYSVKCVAASFFGLATIASSIAILYAISSETSTLHHSSNYKSIIISDIHGKPVKSLRLNERMSRAEFDKMVQETAFNTVSAWQQDHESFEKFLKNPENVIKLQQSQPHLQLIAKYDSLRLIAIRARVVFPNEPNYPDPM